MSRNIKVLKSSPDWFAHQLDKPGFSAELPTYSLSAYNGAVNDGIRVRATDDVRVQSVKLEIYSSTAVLVESGLALMQSNGLDWLYKATVANPGFSGGKVLVSVYDLPGNSSYAEQEF